MDCEGKISNQPAGRQSLGRLKARRGKRDGRRGKPRARRGETKAPQQARMSYAEAGPRDVGNNTIRTGASRLGIKAGQEGTARANLARQDLLRQRRETHERRRDSCEQHQGKIQNRRDLTGSRRETARERRETSQAPQETAGRAKI